jgi:hypothetical protein
MNERAKDLFVLGAGASWLLLAVAITVAHSEGHGPANESNFASHHDLNWDELAQHEPVQFLTKGLQQYRQEVRGYRCILRKQERINGKLQPREIIEVCFREKPHSVYFHWLEGARKADRALYVDGENGGKMLARPSSALARGIVGQVVERDVDGDDARQSGRYSLSEFGIKKAMERTLAAWQAAQNAGKLHVVYLGEAKVKELAGRTCYKLQRNYDSAENDGVTQLTTYVDKENHLQVGSTLKGKDGKLIGEYFFYDLELNPEFSPEQFQRNALVP